MDGTWRRMLHVGLACALALSIALAVPARAVNLTITLVGNTGTGWGWAATNITSPGPTLTVRQGDVITFRVNSTDTQPHTFFIDLDGGGGGDQDSNEPGTSGTFTGATPLDVAWTADRTGSFTYFCGVHPGTMRGTITVQALPSAPGDNTLLIIGGVIVVVIIIVAAAAVMRRKPKQPVQPENP